MRQLGRLSPCEPDLDLTGLVYAGVYDNGAQPGRCDMTSRRQVDACGFHSIDKLSERLRAHDFAGRRYGIDRRHGRVDVLRKAADEPNALRGGCGISPPRSLL